VLLLRRREFHRGILAEVQGRARPMRPAISNAGFAAPAVNASALVFFVVLAFALAAVLMAASCGNVHAERTRPPNVLLLVVDTLRADRLSSYGHTRPTSPNLDRFAEDALRFEQVWAPAPRTVASHASLFTSTEPAVHGVWNEPAQDQDPQDFDALSPAANCLAEVLLQAGFQTMGVADGGWLQIDRGLAQGFRSWESSYEGVERKVDRALERLAERDRSKPFFLFLHTYQVHTPYMPDAESLALFDDGDYDGVLRQALADARAALEQPLEGNPLTTLYRTYFKPHLKDLGPRDLEFLRTLYDAEISMVDRAFARLLAGMEQMGDAEDTLIVITSDHGEEFGEHGDFEHVQVYDECLRVPLIVRLPAECRGRKGVVRREPVSLLDVMPTVLAELDLPIPESASGRTIDLHRAPRSAKPRELWGEMRESNPQVVLIEGPRRAFFSDPADSQVAYFDLEEDPLQLHPGSDPGDGDKFAARARARLQAYRARSAAASARFALEPVGRSFETFNAARLAELQALGYL
jgi:arylsulfatase A-like enzyme